MLKNKIKYSLKKLHKISKVYKGQPFHHNDDLRLKSNHLSSTFTTFISKNFTTFQLKYKMQV